MYIWNINQLKSDIRHNRLTETDRFIYLFIHLFFITVAIDLIGYLPENYEFNIWNAMNSIVNVTFLCIGTYAAYKVNGGNTGVDFLGRYFSLSFVVNVRFIVLLIPVMLVQMLIIASFEDSSETTYLAAIESVLYAIWSGLLYWYLFKQFKAIQN